MRAGLWRVAWLLVSRPWLVSYAVERLLIPYLLLLDTSSFANSSLFKSEACCHSKTAMDQSVPADRTRFVLVDKKLPPSDPETPLVYYILKSNPEGHEIDLI